MGQLIWVNFTMRKNKPISLVRGWWDGFLHRRSDVIEMRMCTSEGGARTKISSQAVIHYFEQLRTILEGLKSFPVPNCNPVQNRSTVVLWYRHLPELMKGFLFHGFLSPLRAAFRASLSLSESLLKRQSFVLWDIYFV
jgi:hypothetical protein